jgi:hypothetical protein
MQADWLTPKLWQKSAILRRKIFIFPGRADKRGIDYEILSSVHLAVYLSVSRGTGTR